MGELRSWQENERVRFLFIKKISVMICLVISRQNVTYMDQQRGEGLRRGAGDGELQDVA